nr:IS3 family transposase [Vibrio hippocampi]
MKSRLDHWKVAQMCSLLEVHRSGFYAWLKSPQSQRDIENQALTTQIKKSFVESGGQYGSPRIAQQLRDSGITVGENRVAKLMREANLNANLARGMSLPNLTNNDALETQQSLSRKMKPNLIWVADITYVETYEGWLYLAVVIDVFSSRVVGWSMCNRLDNRLVNQALSKALEIREPRSQVVVYNELEKHQTDSEYQHFLAIHNLSSSHRHKDLVIDNNVTQQFFSALNDEHVCHQRYTSRVQAKQDLRQYIEEFYNAVRVNDGLGFCSPVEYESLCQNISRLP